MGNEGKIYCPYKGEEIPVSSSSFEHIIPLSLGGCDEFGIRVDRDLNSRFGSSIDGRIANDPFILLGRVRYNARGHAQTPPRAVWKKSIIDGKPVQMCFSGEKIEIFDPRKEEFLEESEFLGKEVTSTFKIDHFCRLPFSAKVALGAGYFLFGDAFAKYADHKQLRALLKPINDICRDELQGNRVRYFDAFSDLEGHSSNDIHKVFEKMINYFGSSSVVVSLSDGSIYFTVGIFGEWFSTISVEAETLQFPLDGEYDLGHVLSIENGGLMRRSLREAARKFSVEVLK